MCSTCKGVRALYLHVHVHNRLNINLLWETWEGEFRVHFEICLKHSVLSRLKSNITLFFVAVIC